MKRLSIALAGLAALASVPVSADTYVFDKAHSEASFQIRHFVSKVRGRFTDFEGQVSMDTAKPEASSVEFKIKATSIDTAVADRDKHLRSPDFFDVEKFPEITFKSSKIVSKGGNAYDVTGTLTMHGVSKDVTLPVSYMGLQKMKDRTGAETAKAGFETNVTINRKDFGITFNRALDSGGFMLGDDVLVSVNIEANKKVDAPPPAPAK